MSHGSFRPLPFVAYRDVTIFHAYKDECSDVPLDYWYSTTDSAVSGSEFEFDVRDLRTVMRQRLDVSHLDDAVLVRKAIELGLLDAHKIPGFAAWLR